MEKQVSSKPVERLFPFVLRARILLIGRETLARSKSKLHFVLITHDLSASSRAQILADFADYPIVERYTAAELKEFFGLENTKVVGFKKSGLAQSLYAELKEYRLNSPKTQQPKAKESKETGKSGEEPQKGAEGAK